MTAPEIDPWSMPDYPARLHRVHRPSVDGADQGARSMNTDGLRAAAERLQYPPLKEAADEIDRLNRSPEHMWLNALSVAVANDRFLVDIGREVVSMLEQSRGRWRAPDDPLLEVTIRFTAS